MLESLFWRRPEVNTDRVCASPAAYRALSPDIGSSFRYFCRARQWIVFWKHCRRYPVSANIVVLSRPRSTTRRSVNFLRQIKLDVTRPAHTHFPHTYASRAAMKNIVSHLSRIALPPHLRIWRATRCVILSLRGKYVCSRANLITNARSLCRAGVIIHDFVRRRHDSRPPRRPEVRDFDALAKVRHMGRCALALRRL